MSIHLKIWEIGSCTLKTLKILRIVYVFCPPVCESAEICLIWQQRKYLGI